MKRPFILLAILIPFLFSFLGLSQTPKGQTAFEVHWWGKAFQGACPSSTYTDSLTPIYVYVAASGGGPWSYKRTDYVMANGDYDVHFYQISSKPWIEFRTVQNDTIPWLKNTNCFRVRFHKTSAVRNQDIVRED